MEDWVPFHRSLVSGAKRGLARAHRFVFMELCLASRATQGVLDLPLGMSDEEGVHDLIGGNRQEIRAALAALTVAPEDDVPMLVFEGAPGRRVLSIPSWLTWAGEREDREAARAERDTKVRTTAAERMRRLRARRRDGQGVTRDANSSPAVTVTGDVTPFAPPPNLPLSRDEQERTGEREGEGPARERTRHVADEQSEANAPSHVRDVLRALRAAPELAHVATLRFAKRLGDFCDPIGGRLGIDDVVGAIREAAAKEGAARDVGEAPRLPKDLAGLVMGFVQRTKRGEAAARQAPLRAGGGGARAAREPSPQHTVTPEYLEREAEAQAARRAEREAIDAAERARPPHERDPFGPDWEPPPEDSDA